MANDQAGGTGALLVAFVAGAVTGAAIALLVAPATGEDAREYLGQRAREGREKAAEAARQGREALNRHRETLTTAFNRGREEYQKSPGGPEEQDA